VIDDHERRLRRRPTPVSGTARRVGSLAGVAAVVGLGGALLGMGPVSILPVAAFVAAAVYLTDVRPKVRSFPKNRSGTHSGPYGPW